MADDAQYDYTQDKEFLAASPDRQHAYLMANDADYAKAPTAKQQAYLEHVGGARQPLTTPGELQQRGALSRTATKPEIPKVTNTETNRATRRNAMAQPGITPQARKAAPSNQRVMQGLTDLDVAANTAMIPYAAVEAPVALAGTIAGGALGAPIGRRAVGAFTKDPELQDLGAWTGATVGSVAGGLGADRFEFPEKINLPGNIKFNVPKRLVMPAATEEEMAGQRAARKLAQRNADIKAGVKEVAPQPAGQATNAPSQFQAPLPPAGSVPQPTMAAPQAAAAPAGVKPNEFKLPSTVPEAHSVQGAGGEAWSMQRKITPQLQRAAAAGDPGAIAVMRRLNPNWRPVITPANIGYPAPRSITTEFQPAEAQQEVEQGARTLTQPERGSKQVGAKAAKIEQGNLQDPQQKFESIRREIIRLQAIIDNPKATAQERGIATAQLKAQKEFMKILEPPMPKYKGSKGIAARARQAGPNGRKREEPNF